MFGKACNQQPRSDVWWIYVDLETGHFLNGALSSLMDDRFDAVAGLHIYIMFALASTQRTDAAEEIPDGFANSWY